MQGQMYRHERWGILLPEAIGEGKTTYPVLQKHGRVKSSPSMVESFEINYWQGPDKETRVTQAEHGFVKISAYGIVLGAMLCGPKCMI